MAFLIRPGLWSARQQPQVAVEIDWTHPLARGLVMCFLARPGGGMVDLTGRKRVVSGVTQPVRPSGLTFNTWSVTNASTADLNFTSGGWAIGAFTYNSVLPSVSGQSPSPYGRWDYTSESVNSGWFLGSASDGFSTTAWQCFSFNNNAFSSYQLLGTSPVYVGDVFLGQTSDGTTRRLIVNGIQESTLALSPNPATTTGVMAPNIPANGAFDGSYLLLAWNRDVPNLEWAWLNAEPYCFLRPRAVAAPRSVPLVVGSISHVFRPPPIQIWDR